MDAKELVKNTGERIRAWRKEKNLTQDELAKQLGVDRTTVGSYESGESLPIEFVFTLVIKYNVDIYDLLPSQFSADLVADEGLNEHFTYMQAIDAETRTTIGKLIKCYYLDSLRASVEANAKRPKKFSPKKRVA